MPMLTPAQISQKWLSNYQGAATAMTQGAQAVNQAPGVAAAAAVQTWLTRLQASAAKWQAKVSAVTLQEWQQAYINLGIPRGQAGAAAKQAKYTTFITAYMAFLQTAVAQVKAMPKGTLQAGINRAVAMINASAQWGASRV